MKPNKLWQKKTKNSTLSQKQSQKLISQVEKFTVGQDTQFDLLLAPYDIQGSIAHVKMLGKVKLLKPKEVTALARELEKMHKLALQGNFKIEKEIEDIHSQVEHNLTKKLGDLGKKIHMARSRNDQVLLDLKLFLRAELKNIANQSAKLSSEFLSHAKKYQSILIPGYTHFQVAMPSSFGLWFSAYAECLIDDLIPLHAAYLLTQQNPLGSAAGYGSSFPIDREYTTKLLNFKNLDVNVVYAQMNRGRIERIVASALSNLADTLSKMAMESCLYLSQNFSFFSFPSELTTGSSIMPHKKNPDVFELVRSKCNQIKGLSNEFFLQTTNLPSGYHRDFQLLKEHLFPALFTLKECMGMMSLMFQHVKPNTELMQDPKYRYAFSVEEVNKRVLKGKTFRDAYREVGEAIENGEYDTQLKAGLSSNQHQHILQHSHTLHHSIHHTHIGSIGNLRLDLIQKKLKINLKRFEE